jgi:hypothetical protein
MDDDILANIISLRGRDSAIRYFGKDNIMAAWRKFLD